MYSSTNSEKSGEQLTLWDERAIRVLGIMGIKDPLEASLELHLPDTDADKDDTRNTKVASKLATFSIDRAAS